MSVAITDFNGGGRQDLAVGTPVLTGNLGSVAILLGNGDGTFLLHMYYPAANVPQAPAAGDFNRDGKPDLAVTGIGGLSIPLERGAGALQPPAFYDTGAGPFGIPQGVAVGDLNGDGAADLAGGQWLRFEHVRHPVEQWGWYFSAGCNLR